DAVRGHAILLTLVCLLFVLALSASMLSLAMLFVPLELLSESLRATWSLLFVQPPPWAQFALQAVACIATRAIDAFYVGAGFGLYLNRRTRIEAWDVEIALRRMRTRLASTAGALLLAACALSLLPLPSQAAAQRDRGAQDAGPPQRERAAAALVDDGQATGLGEIFGDALVADAGFERAVARAYDDPLLRPKDTRSRWRGRDREWGRPQAVPCAGVARAIAFLGGCGRWLRLGALLVVLAVTAKRWLPWLRGGLARGEAPEPVDVADAALPDVLPTDIAAA